jgi:condensin complex subunit 3
VAQLFVPIFEHVAEACKGADDDDTDQVSPAQLALMFVDWTDPQKAVCVIFLPARLASCLQRVTRAVQDQDADPMIHFDLAHDIAKDALLCENKLSSKPTLLSCPAKKLMHCGCKEEDKKVLYQLFSKLYLPDDVDEVKVRTLKTLVEQVKSVSHIHHSDLSGCKLTRAYRNDLQARRPRRTH